MTMKTYFIEASATGFVRCPCLREEVLQVRAYVD
jgi:hypothetical protein